MTGRKLLVRSSWEKTVLHASTLYPSLLSVSFTHLSFAQTCNLSLLTVYLFLLFCRRPVCVLAGGPGVILCKMRLECVLEANFITASLTSHSMIHRSLGLPANWKSFWLLAVRYYMSYWFKVTDSCRLSSLSYCWTYNIKYLVIEFICTIMTLIRVLLRMNEWMLFTHKVIKHHLGIQTCHAPANTVPMSSCTSKRV